MMSKNEKAKKLFYDSLNYIHTRDYQTALQLLTSANDLCPNRKSILSNLCKIYYELDDLNNVKKYLDILLVNFKRDLDINFIEIAYNIKKGNFNIAILQIESLEVDENSNEKLFLELEVHEKLYNYEKVNNILSKLISNNKDNINFLKKLIFMTLYSNPFDHLNFNLLVDKFVNLAKVNNRVILEKQNDKYDHRLSLGFIVNRYPRDPALKQITGVLKELKKYPIILHVFLDNNLKIKFKDLEDLFHHIHDINVLSINEASKLISSQNIDFLFDLAGYSANNRIEILMLKPARKIISWAGFLCDTKIDEIDYIILDKFCDSNNLEKIDKNKKLLIDDIWCPYYISHKEISEIKPKSKYCDSFNYGSFANPFKYNLELIKTWSEILNNSYKTKLIINYFNLGYPDCAENLYDKFYKFGVSKDKIVISGLKKKKEIFCDYNEIDLILDTFPYGGMTTNFDAILMNVPFLTLRGNQFLSNCGYSINKNLELEFLICENIQEYINKAICLSKNINKVNKFKNQIKLKKFSSTLFDEKSFTKKLLNKLYKIKNKT